MKYKNKYRIEPNRWQYWDYSQPGDYFITIVSENRECIFGKIEKNRMNLSEFGKIVESELLKINDYNSRVKLDEYVIMPNHVHFILKLLDYNSENPNTYVNAIKQNRELTNEEIKQYRKIRRNMLAIKILGKFKQQTSKKINILRNTQGVKNWQHDFYDHVIRNNDEYQRIQHYIINNQINWNDDDLYG